MTKAALFFIAGVIVGALLTAAFNSHAKPAACYPLNSQHAVSVCTGGRT